MSYTGIKYLQWMWTFHVIKMDKILIFYRNIIGESNLVMKEEQWEVICRSGKRKIIGISIVRNWKKFRKV